MAMLRIFACLAFVGLSSIPSTDSVRCFECRSDVHRNCGDPFIPSQVPSTECSDQSTYPTVTCYKSSLYVGGSYIVVRGCAPFNTDHFDKRFQRGMVGNYWRGRNLFSLCDYDQCNSAPVLGGGGPTKTLALTMALILGKVLFQQNLAL